VQTVGREWRVITAALLVASCMATPPPAPTSTAVVAAPTAGRRSSTPSAPPSAPTEAPAPTDPPLAARWEKATGAGEGPVDVARGPSGWVAVGSPDCADPSCLVANAAAWFSEDGLTWSGGTIPDSGNTYLTTVAADGSGWLAAGYSYVDEGGSAGVSYAVIWASPDGRSWSLVDSIRQGPCLEGCPSIGELAVLPGVAILSWVQTINPDRSGLYRSENGGRWRRVDRATFGPGASSYAFPSVAAEAGGRFVVVTALCEGCATVWTSADGRDWTPLTTLSPQQAVLDVATDGQRVVVLEQAEWDDRETSVWTSADGRSEWTRGGPLPIWQPRITYAGNRFLAAGETAPNGVGVFSSSDGMSWAPVRNDLYLGDWGNCGLDALAGAEDRVVAVVADESCTGIWVSSATRSP
jgi:hypothetical protein